MTTDRIDQMTQQDYIEDAYQTAEAQINDALIDIADKVARHEDDSEGKRTLAHVVDLNKIADALTDIVENR